MTERFGRYQLLARIGAGGMAEVFRARLEAPGGAEKILVIKRIRPSLGEDPGFLRRFVEEARIALPLSHDNVTSVFEFGEVEGQYFLAMEYVHGQNLAAVLRRAVESQGRLPAPLALFIAAEVSKGLAYAHGALSPDGEPLGLVHLDVSPQNILVSYDGAVKLTDFGIAKAFGAAPPEAVDSGVAEPLIGKASYLAPEQALGSAVDPRTDVYALACVLYESLAGDPPHGRGDDDEILARVRAGEVAPPSTLDPALAPFDPLLRRVLAPSPDDRLPSAAAFHAALSRALFEWAPGTEAPQLATWMRHAFAHELQLTRGTPERRDHVRQQLEAAGFHTRDAATLELLDLATVALPGPPEPAAQEHRSSRRRRFGLGALSTAAVAAALLAIPLFTPSAQEPVVAPAPAETASLSLHSWPSAQVELNGEALGGQTPIADLELPAGDHHIVFRHPELGLQKAIELHLVAGTTRTVVVTLR